MAKKAAAKKKKVVKKKPAKRPGKGGKSPPKKKAAQKKVVKKKAKTAGIRRKSALAALGRARVPGTADLDRYFTKDYEAREVFHFLGVRTLKDLEQFSAEQIIERLTGPMMQTVNRIRKALALQNRCLAGDQQFAADFKKQMLGR